MDEAFHMSHDKRFCGGNAAPEQDSRCQREDETTTRFHSYANARQISETLVPPKAKEFDMAASSVATGRADPGT